MSIVDAISLAAPRLTFAKDMPSHSAADAWKGLNQYGPFDNSRVSIHEKSILFVFPRTLQPLAHKLAKGLEGHRGFRGIEQMFRVPFSGKMMDYLAFDATLTSPRSAAASYKEAILGWNQGERENEALAAIVLVPRSDRWETERPYYEAKSAFAQLGIPTQMVTAELVENDSQFGWSVANIALALFAKLGGVPWLIETPPGEDDLIIGIGKADIRRPDGTERLFGYALSFASNGYYRQAWAFKPVATQDEYETALREAVAASLRESESRLDQPPSRIVLHLGQKTGEREIGAIENAIRDAGLDASTAFLRLDRTTLYDLADGRADTLAPPKGIAARLGPRRALLQPDEAGPLGPSDGPLLIELNERSSVEPEALDELVAQAFALGHANWRGFNARSRPVTLVYGELLARLVGYLEEVDTWSSDLLRSDLRDRPWFL